MSSDQRLKGILHFFVAFDWAEVADLDRAKDLATAELRDLPRRSFEVAQVPLPR